MYIKKNLFLTIFLIPLFSTDATAQVSSAALQAFVNDGPDFSELNYEADVKRLYNTVAYETIWINKKNEANRSQLLSLLNNSSLFGLSEKDYQFDFINGCRTGNISLHDKKDSLKAEVLLSDAALHFLNDVAYGNSSPSLGYDAYKFKPSCYTIPQLLADYTATNQLSLLIASLSAGLAEIKLIISRIQLLLERLPGSDFEEKIISEKKTTAENKPLAVKMYQLGLIDSPFTKASDSLMKQSVKKAQQLFNLPDDGVISTTLLQELNVPLSLRLLQLNTALNYYRWLNCFIKNKKVIVVNIPAAYLKVYAYTTITLEMRMIVGKPSTPTPTLLSTVSEVVLYPYWHVPYSIATKELLPLIKRNTGFLELGNYQVLNSLGKVVDPYSINWQMLSRKYFPYVIRQSTGCDNSLGLLKLNFYSPFGVYLHDTPADALFKMNKRYFSHGCMRMEKPFELGHLVLRNNPIAIDTLEEKGCLLNQSPVVVPADEKMPVLVWYNPVGINAKGQLVFYEDVYEKFLHKK
jgi:L,D-transpeptidase YcbB